MNHTQGVDHTQEVDHTPRPVFFVSDSTGITAETLGTALLSQFPQLDFAARALPFVDSVEGARRAAAQIRAAAGTAEPIVFVTVRDRESAAELSRVPGEVIDLLGPQLSRLEQVLGATRADRPTGHHRVGDPGLYRDRIEAIEYTLDHDDGRVLAGLENADLVLIAPSRCGKTPTALYLALQHGLRVANYPLTDDDPPGTLPAALEAVADRLFGLTTTAARLSRIREERRPGSDYAALARCRTELRNAETLYRSRAIPSVDSHAMSVEEMASRILHTMNLRRRRTGDR